MEKTDELQTVQGWFAGRLPEGWFAGTQVSFDGDQIVVVGKLPDVALDKGASAEQRAGAASGRITRFREQTRRERIGIAQEAEAKFGRPVTWGATCFKTTETFTPGGSGRGTGSAEGRKVMIGRRGWRGRGFRQFTRRMYF